MLNSDFKKKKKRTGARGRCSKLENTKEIGAPRKNTVARAEAAKERPGGNKLAANLWMCTCKPRAFGDQTLPSARSAVAAAATHPRAATVPGS